MNKEEQVSRIDELINLANKTLETADKKAGTPKWVNEELFVNFKTSSISFIKNLFGVENPYYIEFELMVRSSTESATYNGRGILSAIKTEISSERKLNTTQAIRSQITNNKQKIEYVLDELALIEEKLNSRKNIMPGELRRYSDEIDLLKEQVFEKEHEIFKRTDVGYINHDSILKHCNIAYHYLELELLNSHSDLSNLHSKVIEVSEEQFNNKHYREAVVNAFIALIEVIKEKHPIADSKGKFKDGVDLMQDVFSKDSPKIKFSEDPSERQGLMFLYSGAVAGIRNKYGHKTSKINDKYYALELLHFASALFRLLDNQNIY